MIDTYLPKPRYHREAHILRDKYSLTYLDSLHAAVAIVEDQVLLSYDKRHSRMAELKYIHPEELLKGPF